MVKRSMLVIAAACWAITVGIGLAILWDYENAPGPPGAPPRDWPAASRLRPARDQATLVMAAHPQCPCTRASIGELAELMARVRGRVAVYVLFYRPADSPAGWERTDLWRSAASIPDVHVLGDEDGREARRFGAVTSGQTLLYSREGRLLFSGGITASRGHSGDNAGRSAVEALLAGRPAARAQTFVFGCFLQGPAAADSRTAQSLEP